MLRSFQLNGHTLGFHPQTQKQNHLLKHNKQYHRKALLKRFNVNGHTLRVHTWIQN